MMMDWDYMFEIIETGERFFVECANMGECTIILNECNFAPKDLRFIGKFSPEEAEYYGYDTY